MAPSGGALHSNGAPKTMTHNESGRPVAFLAFFFFFSRRVGRPPAPAADGRRRRPTVVKPRKPGLTTAGRGGVPSWTTRPADGSSSTTLSLRRDWYSFPPTRSKTWKRKHGPVVKGPQECGCWRSDPDVQGARKWVMATLVWWARSPSATDRHPAPERILGFHGQKGVSANTYTSDGLGVAAP